MDNCGPRELVFEIIVGPVPHLAESFELEEGDGGTVLTWSGELGTDLWRVGRWWGSRVAAAWERAVESSVGAIKAEAERRARRRS